MASPWYQEWRGLLDDSELREVVGGNGTRYSVTSAAIDDGDGRVRMVVCVSMTEAGRP